MYKPDERFSDLDLEWDSQQELQFETASGSQIRPDPVVAERSVRRLWGQYVEYGQAYLRGHPYDPTKRYDVLIYEDELIPESQLYPSSTLPENLYKVENIEIATSDRQDAKAYTLSRRDRMSRPGDWRPWTFVVNVEIQHENWELVQLFLWDKTRLVTRYYGHLGFSIPKIILIKAVEEYFQGCRNNVTHERRERSTQPLKHIISSSSNLLRGRQRRKVLRHQDTNPTASKDVQSTYLPAPTAIGFHEIEPSTQLESKIARGRQRRRRKRHGTRRDTQDIPLVLAHLTRKATLLSKLFTNSVPAMAKAIDIKSSQYSVPFSASAMPVIVLSQGEHGGKQFVGFKIPADSSFYFCGSIIIPRSLCSNLVGNGLDDRDNTNTFNSISTLAPLKEPGNRQYWEKWDFKRATSLPDIEFSLSLIWSFHQPPLIFPEIQGVLASEDDYLQIYYLPPRGEEVLAMPHHSRSFEKMMRTISTEWLHRPLPTIEKCTSSERDMTSPILRGPPSWPNSRELDNIRAEYHFGRAFYDAGKGIEGLIDLQNPNPETPQIPDCKRIEQSQEGFTNLGISEPLDVPGLLEIPEENALDGGGDGELLHFRRKLFDDDSPSQQNPMGQSDDENSETWVTTDGSEISSSDPYADGIEPRDHGLYDEPRDVDLFYGSSLYGHAPLWLQEIFVSKILRIISSGRHHSEVMACAMLQYGMCFLIGFGVTKSIENGLRWAFSAAEWGSRRARAIVHRLYRAYESPYPHRGIPSKIGWAYKEAQAGSLWALKELQYMEPNVHRAARLDVTMRFVSRDDPLDRYGTFYRWTQDHQKAFSWHQPSVLQEELVKTRTMRPRDSFYEPALRWACVFASPETVEVLLQEQKQEYGHFCIAHTYLLIAARCGNTRVVKRLLELNEEVPGLLSFSNPDENPLFFIDNTPGAEMKSLVRCIVERGWDVNDKADVKSILTCAMQEKYDRTWNMYDPEAYIDTNFLQHWRHEVHGNSITPLRWSIIRNNAAMAEALLACGAEFPVMPAADTYARTKPRGFSADICEVAVLDEPCYNINILQLFSDKHGHQKKKPPFAETPLGLIVMELDGPSRRLKYGELCHPSNLYPVLDMLRAYEPDSDAQLMWASVMNDHNYIVQYLIQAGIDVDIRFKGLTPLHTSILHGRMDIFTFLLDNGADPHATTINGVSTMHLVLWKPRPHATEQAMINALVGRGVLVSGEPSTFSTLVHIQPLHIAVLNNRYDAAKLLLQLGADRTIAAGQDFMTTMAGAPYTSWGVERAKMHEMHGADPKTNKRPVSLRGCTPLGVLLTRIDIFQQHNAMRMLWLLLGPPADRLGDIDRYYTHPAAKTTVLHMMVSIKSLMEAGMFERVLLHGAKAGLHVDQPDADGDSPLHYALLNHGSVDSLITLGAKTTVRNNFGMTPASLQFWGDVALSGWGRTISLTIGLKPPSYDTSDHEKASGIQVEVPQITWTQWHMADQLPGDDFGLVRMWERLRAGFFVDEIWDVEENKSKKKKLITQWHVQLGVSSQASWYIRHHYVDGIIGYCHSE